MSRKRPDTVGEIGPGASGSPPVVPFAPASDGIRPASGHRAGFPMRSDCPPDARFRPARRIRQQYRNVFEIVATLADVLNTTLPSSRLFIASATTWVETIASAKPLER